MAETRKLTAGRSIKGEKAPMSMIKKTVSAASGTFGTLAMAASQAAAADNAAAAGNPLGQFLPLILIFVIFYFFLIRPQQKKAKEHQQLLNAIKKDERIVTTGGLYGTVVAVRGDILEVRIAENVKVQIARSAISTVVAPDVPAAPAETK